MFLKSSCRSEVFQRSNEVIWNSRLPSLATVIAARMLLALLLFWLPYLTPKKMLPGMLSKA
jgi:hypothetical protein